MGRSPAVSFRFEKNRLLYRGKNVEIWEGWLEDQNHLVKRFMKPRSVHWHEFALLSRLKHSIVLKPSSAGYARDGSLCYGMPVDFAPARKQEFPDLPQFSIGLLSLIYGLHQKKIDTQWHPDHIVSDAGRNKSFLAGVQPVKQKEFISNDIRHLTALHNFVSKQVTASHQLVKILRKWIRRKEGQIPGCLQDLLREFPHQLEKTLLHYEWPCTRELELIAGLYRLAEQGKGRTLILQGEAGEGKSSLLRQMHSELLLRDSRTIYFSAQKEERPLHSAKSFLRLIQQTSRLTQATPKEMTENTITEFLLKGFEESMVVTNVLIDNFQHCDPCSRRLFLNLFQHSTNLKVLFLISCDVPVSEASDFIVSLPLQRPDIRQIHDSAVVPFWQEKQRKHYLNHIYQRTSGNLLFFHEYLSEVIRNHQGEMIWTDGEWNFTQSSVPDFPPALLDFYWNSAPEFHPDEMTFLEIASLRGEPFNAAREDQRLLDSLVQKNVLIESAGKYRFRKALFSEAIRKRLDPQRLKQIYKTLANELSLSIEPESMNLLARYYWRAGDPTAALKWTCKALEEVGHSAEPSALTLLDEIESQETNLSLPHKLLLFTRQAAVYFKRGKFPHAAVSFRKAMECAGEDPILRFTLGLSVVESHILQEDIVSAQQALANLREMLTFIKDEASLFRYYMARGVCSHYRGPRNTDDFQRAFEFAEALSDDALLAHGYRRCAWLSLKEGELTEASKLARRALRYAKLSRDSEEMGHCYKIFASIAWRKSRHEHAEKFMKKSIRAFQRTQNEFGCAGVWNLLGNVYLEKYRFKESARCFAKAVALFGHLDHSREVSLAQFNMGLVYLEQGRLKDAEKIFLRCRAIDKTSGNRWFYAYDQRALAVYCILQGYPRKATRLLMRTLEICEGLKADGDILQTKMILLFHQLDQGNYRDARSLVSFLEQRLDGLKEPLTEAEIHHLLAYYYGYTNESVKADIHLKKSLLIGRRIRHYKLIGKNLILSLIFRRLAPRQDDPELRKAILYFRKSRNHLEFADYLLKLYQAYPALTKDKSHLKRVRWMESLYHHLQIRTRFDAIRRIVRARSAEDTTEPAYGWWHSVLALMMAPQDLQSRLTAVLKELSKELHSSYCQIQYLSSSGTFERVLYSDMPLTNTVEELPGKIFDQVFRRRETLYLDVRSDPKLCGDPWVILNEVRSVLAIPFFKSDQFLGFWYFERRKDASIFSANDSQKASFFATACTPLLERAVDHETATQSDRLGLPPRFQDLIGNSLSMDAVGRLVDKVAPLDVSVLITGESGTGKELVARNIHRLSKRSGGPFVPINCSAIPETLIESELFGHARGAFTGAVAAKQGSIERAQKGTLFLDEIGDLSAAAQAKLLRVIQEREVQRLGETTIRKIDVRFLFATHKNIERLATEGSYRQDLFYRISGYTLSVPPLRDRKEDIPLLIAHFTEKYSVEFEKKGIRFSGAATKLLCDYAWPGNVRELENLVQTTLVNSDSDTIVESDALPRALKAPRLAEMALGLSLEQGRELFDRDFILQALKRNEWNKSRTAKELKITRQGLINMIQRLRLEKK